MAMNRQDNSLAVLVVIVVILAVAFKKDQKCNEEVDQRNLLKYWPFVKVMWNINDNLRSVKRVFDRHGHVMVNGSIDEDWDVMWSIEYPFALFSKEMKNLKPRQKVNHIPGINYITLKSFMTTHNRLDFIPPAFEFPHMAEDFRNYIKHNPEKKFVQKNGENRGVKIVSVDDINCATSEGNFYQEFIGNPLLIDDRAFDLGVYVLISSINPLRIYRYKGDVLLRFCPEPYHPFDAENVDKYVVYETLKTIFDMPSLKEMCTKMGFSSKASFEAHLTSRGFDMEELWAQVDDAIVSLVLSNENNFIAKTKEFGSTDHFFELVRFDFIIDDDFTIHLMEVNMSPNLTPRGERFEGLALSFEQVVLNTLQCVMGISSYSDHHLRKMQDVNTNSSFNDVAVNLKSCLTNNCETNCEDENCKLCLPCVNSDELNSLHQAYREHIRRGEMARIFPSTDHFENDFINELSPANKLMASWFKFKCESDSDWC